MSIPGPSSRGEPPAPPAGPPLSLRGVSKSYAAVRAVRDVSVDCNAGEIHALAVSYTHLTLPTILRV